MISIPMDVLKLVKKTEKLSGIVSGKYCQDIIFTHVKTGPLSSVHVGGQSEDTVYLYQIFAFYKELPCGVMKGHYFTSDNDNAFLKMAERYLTARNIDYKELLDGESLSVVTVESYEEYPVDIRPVSLNEIASSVMSAFEEIYRGDLVVSLDSPDMKFNGGVTEAGFRTGFMSVLPASVSDGDILTI